MDDKREMPAGFDLWVERADYCMNHVRCGHVSHISFDHDLGSGGTGYMVANLIEELAYQHKIAPITWDIHSANPVGVDRIKAAMTSAERFWGINQESSNGQN